MSKENNHPLGENSLSLVALLSPVLEGVVLSRV
jgi:hypothetical protein